MKKIVVVAGPTAAGKTRLGIELALGLGGEIVSADSMQVYRRMDIGTAKASAEERALVPHHMLDVAEPFEDYSAARYVEQAAACCEDILARGRLPIVVGGTGLYIDSLLSGRDFAPRQEGEEKLRRELSDRYEAEGGAALLEELRAFDPERAEKLHPGDKRRIIRAMEIYALTGLTISEHDRRSRSLPPRYEAARIVLNYKDRARLYARIDRRVEEMAAQGLFGEVEGLLKAGLSPGCTAMQAIGYKEAARYLRGETDRQEALDLIKQGSRRYAKRQITWFSRWDEALRIDWEAEPDFSLACRLSTNYLCRSGIS